MNIVCKLVHFDQTLIAIKINIFCDVLFVTHLFIAGFF